MSHLSLPLAANLRPYLGTAQPDPNIALGWSPESSCGRFLVGFGECLYALDLD